MIYVESYGYKGSDEDIIINTTSRSKTWSNGLSPFFLGPVELYGGYKSLNIENAWQYSKVYKQFMDAEGNPSKDYFTWAQGGWNNSYANRYPMGKGVLPEYSYWNGKKLSYTEARREIYIPLYAKAVHRTLTFKMLQSVIENNPDKNIYLLDFDGYNYTKLNMTFDEVINDSKKKMGHAFVLAMLLHGYVNAY